MGRPFNLKVWGGGVGKNSVTNFDFFSEHPQLLLHCFEIKAKIYICELIYI